MILKKGIHNRFTGSLKSLQATARLVKNNGAQVFTNLEEVAEYLNQEQLATQVVVPPKRWPCCQLV